MDLKNGKNIKITLKSLSTPTGEAPDVIELITEGTLRSVTDAEGRNGWEISYFDSEATGFQGSETIVSCFGEELASMIRKGSTESNLIIEKGRKHHCHYGTEYGSMMIGIYTHRIINRLSESGGELYFKYTIDVNSVLISDNEVYMEIALA